MPRTSTAGAKDTTRVAVRARATVRVRDTPRDSAGVGVWLSLKHLSH